MGFSSEDRYWLKKCRDESDTYRIMINENSIYVVNMRIDKMLHEFSRNNMEFIRLLLDYVGISSEIV